MTFVSLWPIRFYGTMKLECSSQRIPRAVVLGLLELNCDWFKVPTSQKSFPGSVRRRYFSAETSDSRKYDCVRRLSYRWTMANYLYAGNHGSYSHQNTYPVQDVEYNKTTKILCRHVSQRELAIYSYCLDITNYHSNGISWWNHP